MTIRTNVPGATNFALQSAIGAYSDEAYTNAKKLNSTALVGGNPQIDTNTETFIGQMRWFKPISSLQINVASLTDPTDGTPNTYSSDYLKYIKTVRTYGGDKINMQQVVTQQDGLAKIGRDFGESRAQDEHNAVLAVLKGVAISEALIGAGAAGGGNGLGGQSFDSDPAEAKCGFYVDLGAAKNVVDATATIQGAARAEGFLRAFGMAYKDYEPDYAYMVVSPETLASLRSANLVDQTTVTEGNVVFSTIFGGKFRLIQTRASQGFTAAERTKINTGTGVDITGAKCTYIVLPGSIAMESLAVPDPVEIARLPAKYKGGGTTSIWHRWGYVAHPAGYSWAGSEDAFPSDANFYDALEGGAQKTLTAVGSATLVATTGVWARKTSSVLSLGILPIFHS